MKKLSIILAVILVLTLGALAYALYSKSLPSHVRIIEEAPGPTVSLEFYQDKQATTPITSLEWGDLLKGQSNTQTFYTKNTGELSVSLTGGSTLPEAVGAVSFVFDTNPLDVNKISKVDVSLLANATAPLGDANFDLVISAAGLQNDY